MRELNACALDWHRCRMMPGRVGNAAAALQHLAAEIPAVASPVGTQATSSGPRRTPGICRLVPVASPSGVGREPESGLHCTWPSTLREQFSTSSWAERVRELWCGRMSVPNKSARCRNVRERILIVRLSSIGDTIQGIPSRGRSNARIPTAI